MPTTPVLALPYPNATDTADVPRDIQALAVKLDGYTSLRPPQVSSLPGSPVDGQEVYYLADATNGVVWHLRYRSAATGSYKWEMIGGSALYAEVVALESTPSVTFVALTTAGPVVTIPLAGDYEVTLGARMFNDGANAAASMSYDVGATAALDVDGMSNSQGTGISTGNSSRTRRKLALAAATALTAKYKRAGGANASFEQRWLRALPVRVG